MTWLEFTGCQSGVAHEKDASASLFYFLLKFRVALPECCACPGDVLAVMPDVSYEVTGKSGILRSVLQHGRVDVAEWLSPTAVHRIGYILVGHSAAQDLAP